MSPVSKKAASPAPSLPPEFSHPALQKLLKQGRTNGSVDSGQLRDALEGAEIAPKRMKAVLRSLDEQGIHVTLDSTTASRAVAATSTRKKTATAPAKKTAAKTTAPAAKTATKTAAKAAAPKAAAAKAEPAGRQARQGGHEGSFDQGLFREGCAGQGDHDQEGRCRGRW